jgi:hypothetical protein
LIGPLICASNVLKLFIVELLIVRFDDIVEFDILNEIIEFVLEFIDEFVEFV